MKILTHIIHGGRRMRSVQNVIFDCKKVMCQYSVRIRIRNIYKKFIRKFDKESLFNTSTESSNTTMNLFQQEQDESLKSEEFQEESRHQDENSESQKNSRLKLFSHEMIFQE